jgi:histidinol-phosphatase (PHP family)
VYRWYLTHCLKMVVANGFFDAFAHLDYISRYSPLDEKNVLYSQYTDEYDALLRALVERDKLLEINTSRFGEAGAQENLHAIYSRYYALGGRYVTIGSDAHGPSRLGYRYADALRMAQEIGLKATYFKGRQMHLSEVH